MRMVPTFTVVRLTGEASGFTPAASSWLRRRPSPRPAGPDTYHRSDSSPPATTISDGPDKRLRTANQPRSTGFGVFPKKWRRSLCREFVDVSES